MKQLLPALLLAALICFTPLNTSANPDDSEQHLLQVVEKVWACKAEKNRDALYELVDEKYRSQVTLNQFRGRQNVTIKDYEILAVSVFEDGITGESNVAFSTVIMGNRVRTNVKERYKLENGQWRLQLSDLPNPFTTKSNADPIPQKRKKKESDKTE